MIREVVLLAFREGVPSERLRAFETALTNLRQQIDEIREFEWGLNASRENLAAGFSHCFLVTFDNLAARDRYVDHPDYRAALAMMEPWIEKRLVFDYKPRNGLA